MTHLLHFGRRLSALLILLSAVVMSYLVLVRPLTDRIAEAQEQIAQQRVLLSKLLAKANEQTSLPGATGKDFVAGLLAGGTAAARIASLQSHVEVAAAGGGVQISSSHAKPEQLEDHLAIIGVQLHASGTISELQGLLHALEAGSPTVIVDQLDVIRSPVSKGEPERDLDIRMVILGAAVDQGQIR